MDSSATLKRNTRKYAEYFCAACLVIFTTLVIYSVTMRYFFHKPPLWGEDIPKLLFVWMSFIGAGFAYMFGLNIRMTTIIDKFAIGPRRIIEFAMHLCVVAMLLVILWYSLPILKLASRNTVLSTGLSDIWTYLALPAGTIILLINEFVRLYRIARGGIDHDEANPEDQIV